MLVLKRIPLYVWILLSIILGVGWGLLAVNLNLNAFSSDWISPWGEIFIRLLKLIAIPLIFVSLVKGIADLGDSKRLSGLGLRTFLLYIVTTVIAISIGLLIVNAIQPGKVFPADKQAEMMERYAEEMSDRTLEATALSDQGPLQFLIDIVPDNIIGASGNNRNMLQVIFFAMLFGIALVSIKSKHKTVVVNFFNGLNDVVLKMIDIIMRFAPFGVFALMADAVVSASGDARLFASMGLYALSVIIGLLLMIIIVYPLLVKLLAKIAPGKFLSSVLPAQLLAFSTSSSAATLPMTKKCCDENLGVHPEISNFVLPIGATINMDGTSLYQAVAAVFIAQTLGVDLDIGAQLTIILTATLASIGSAAVPGAGMVMLIVVLESIGLPSEGLVLIMAMDRPLDMLRTAVNVTGDSAVSSIVDYREGKSKF